MRAEHETLPIGSISHSRTGKRVGSLEVPKTGGPDKQTPLARKSTNLHTKSRLIERGKQAVVYNAVTIV